MVMNIIAHMVHPPPIHNDCFVNKDFIVIIIIIIIIIGTNKTLSPIIKWKIRLVFVKLTLKLSLDRNHLQELIIKNLEKKACRIKLSFSLNYAKHSLKRLAYCRRIKGVVYFVGNFGRRIEIFLRLKADGYIVVLVTSVASFAKVLYVNKS